MRKHLNILLAVFILSSIYVGCKEKPLTLPDDLEAPQITMSSPEVVEVGTFVEVDNLDSINVDIRFEDDLELESYSIEVKKRYDLNFLKAQSDAWTHTVFGQLSGKVDAYNATLRVPYDPTAGPYEFVVTCTDSVGKVTRLTTYLKVTNNEDALAPNIVISSPNTSVLDTFQIGDVLSLSATVSDANLVRNCFARVRDAFSDEVMAGSEFQWDTVFATPFLVDTNFVIPAGVVPGRYKVEFYGEDQIGNFGYELDTIYVRPN